MSVITKKHPQHIAGSVSGTRGNLRASTWPDQPAKFGIYPQGAHTTGKYGAEDKYGTTSSTIRDDGSSTATHYQYHRLASPQPGLSDPGCTAPDVRRPGSRGSRDYDQPVRTLLHRSSNRTSPVVTVGGQIFDRPGSKVVASIKNVTFL